MSPFWVLLELRMTEVTVTTAPIRHAKLQSNRHHQQTNTQLYTGRMPPSCRPSKSVGTLNENCYHWMILITLTITSCVGCPAPCKLTFELLTLKVVSESRVTWATSEPILVFLGLSVLDLGPIYVKDRRRTSDRQTSDMHHRLMPLP